MNLLAFLLICCICHFTSAAEISIEKNFLFLSYEQFENLRPSEQKQYLSELQKLVIDFEDQLSEKQDHKTKWSFLFEKFVFQTSEAGETNINLSTYESSRVPSSDLDTELSKLDYLSDFSHGYIRAAADHRSQILIDEANKTFVEAYDRLYKLKDKSMNAIELGFYNKTVQFMRANYDQLLSIDDRLKTRRSEFYNFFSEIQNKTIQVKPARPSQPTISKSVTKDLPTRSAKIEKITPQASERKSESIFYGHCIYGGFVIKKQKCEPNSELPSELKIKELSSEKFKCQNKNEVLCNPLVFGYQNADTPYCVPRSRFASRKCQEVANNTENKERLLKLWKNSENKNVFESFQKDLLKLCSKDNNKKDVIDTCKVVIAEFNKTMKTEFPAALKSLENEGSASSRSNRTR